MNIHKAIISVMRDVGAIGKTEKNASQGFAYRSIDQIYNRLQPVMAKHGIFSAPEVIEMKHEIGQTKKGGTMFHLWCRVKYTFFAEDGSSIETVTIGESMDSGDKSGNKAMAAAHKYALVQLFNIPYEDMDPDAHTPEWSTKNQGRISPKQFNEVKQGWWATVKTELKDLDAEEIVEKFNAWVGDAVGSELGFNFSDWRMWQASDYVACQEKLESDAAALLSATGL